MKYLIAAVCLTASPAFAYDRMTTQACQDSWNMFVGAMAPFEVNGEAPLPSDVRVGPGGWCTIDTSDDGWDSTDVSRVGFQIEGADAYLDGSGIPAAIAMRFEGLILGARRYNAEAHVRHLPEAGMLVVEDVTLRHEDGSGISVSYVLQGAYFSDVAGMQTSLAGLRMTELHGQAAINQFLLDDLDVDLSEVNRVSMGEALRDVSRFQVDTATRQAFLRMVSDREGELLVDITSERGFGWIQAVVPFLDISGDADLASALGIAMSGVSIALEWKQGDI
ncbi:hypothetical protein [Yoonia sp. I 8.24]|uniref:hypothetical protein n=1 Tax=Yoonia sp. I 8.24 TaxID=1537229 RepID=UPI001EDEC88A|nr:hypothetical protein [Yoonia sp. I 8.24]MCG3267316.1 hypothetical protein [Yoonia sp. I 8.24]